ncbi:MAG: hypothetical protein ACJAYG_001903, partial [Oceanicoccus sp.]
MEPKQQVLPFKEEPVRSGAGKLVDRLKALNNDCSESLHSNQSRLRQSRLFSRRQGTKKPGSLVRRFQVLLLCWGLLVYVLATSGFWVVSSQVIQSTFEQQAGHWMSNLDELSMPLYASNEVSTFLSIEAYLKNFSEIAYLKYYHADGEKVLAQYRASDFDSELVGQFDTRSFNQYASHELRGGVAISSAMTIDKSWMRLIAPVFRKGVADNTASISGYIDMGLDFSRYQQTMIDNIIKGSLLISIFFLAAAIIGRHLIRRALKPLLDLREPLDRLARGDT